ncbi:MAG: PD40 domain-containing protein [Chloroflexi bacterium]|nr:PD40 domain-containing protein [Chloroflexota bacterium]
MYISGSSLEKTTLNAIKSLLIFMITLLVAFLGGCRQSSQSSLVNVRRLVSLGKPPANEILWSPVNQNKILVSSGYVNFSGGENYVLNTETGEKQILAQTEYGFLAIRTWLPDGKSIIMAANKDTAGFEKGGLWEVSLEDNTFIFLQAETDKIIWGPDEKSLTIERSRKTESGQEKTELVWIDRTTRKETVIFETKTDQTIFGFSWSPGGKQLVFSMGSI